MMPFDSKMEWWPVRQQVFPGTRVTTSDVCLMCTKVEFHKKVWSGSYVVIPLDGPSVDERHDGLRF